MENENTPQSCFALHLFIGWLVITMLWWALAFVPAPTVSPPWLVQARTACFGSFESGLPDAFGWIKLFSPLTILAMLLVMWSHDLLANIRRLFRRPGLASLFVLFLMAPITEAGWIYHRIKTGLTVVSAASEIKAVADFPIDYPRTDRSAAEMNLVDQNGEVTTRARLQGQNTWLTFAFAHCKTICPFIIKNALASMAKANDTVDQLFIITLDPWRDTPSRLPSLAEEWQLPENAFILSGAVADVQKVLQAYKMTGERDEKTGDVVHPAVFYLIDKHAEISYTLNNPSIEVILEAARRTAASEKTAASLN